MLFDIIGIKEMVCKSTRVDGCFMANVGIWGSYIILETLLEWIWEFVNQIILVSVEFLVVSFISNI